MKQRLAKWLRRFPLLGWGLRLGVKLFVSRHHVGAVGVVFNDEGQVLLVEHVFRRYPWGLPGGWIERGEDPAETIRREFAEELGLQVTVGQILLCRPQGAETGVPSGLGLAYLCSLANDAPADHKLKQARLGYELLSVAWVDPTQIDKPLTPLERAAITLARAEVKERK